MRLKNKTAIITGSAKGIGAAIAKSFAREGCNVVINYLSSEKEALEVKKYVDNLGVGSIVVQADVSNETGVEHLFKNSLKKFGKIDILVNNASRTQAASVTESSIADWYKIINTNLSSVFLCSRFVLPSMLKNKEGVIINIAYII